MRAILQDEYGLPDVLEIRDVEKPKAVDDRVLVRVHSSSVNALEWHLMTGVPYLARLQGGFRQPKTKTLGADVAGTVEAVGEAVTQFKPGDEILGAIGVGAYANTSPCRSVLSSQSRQV